MSAPSPALAPTLSHPAMPGRVVVINDRSTALGGATALSLLCARGLAARGIPVTFVAGDDGAGLDGDAGIDVEAVGGRPLTERSTADALVGGLYDARARAVLSRWIARHDRPDTVYHVHGWSKILSPSIFAALARVRERTVLHAHDYFLACPNGGFADYPRRAVCERVPMSAACLTTQCDKRGAAQKAWRVARHALRDRLFDPRAADVLLIHPGMATAYERAGFSPGRLHTVRNPIEPFCPPGSLAPWTRQSLMFAGRLEEEKGFADAADAARRAGMRIEFVGEGAGRAWLERHHPDVPVHGWLDRAGMRPHLARARAVVMPSRVPEPFGMVAVEALASGLPVIASGGAALAPEIVAAGAGLAHAPGDVDSLAAAMATMRDDGTVKAMSHAALRHAPGMAHTTDGWLDALLARYAAVLTRAARKEAFEPVGEPIRATA